MSILPPVDDHGRIVVVAAGFALWTGGRCIAAARWADIERMRAHRPDASDAVRIVVELRDGTKLEFQERAPGFDAFLDRAAPVLLTVLPFAAWHPQLLLSPPGGDGVVIFERAQPKVRRVRKPPPG